MYCIKCGKEIKNDDNFCPFCGSKKVEVTNKKIQEEQQVIYEEIKEEPPVAKASNLVVYEVILLTLGISILMIVFISKMMI